MKYLHDNDSDLMFLKFLYRPILFTVIFLFVLIWCFSKYNIELIQALHDIVKFLGLG